jgi:hypothetical protein
VWSRQSPHTPCLDDAPVGRREAARHEAGHALVAYLGSVAIASVRVTDTGTRTVIPIGEIADAPRAWLLAALAGSVAQPPDLDGERPHVDSTDGKLAYAAGVLTSSTSFADLEGARDDVGRLLAEYRCHHSLLAEYLCAHHNRTIPWSALEAQLKVIFLRCGEDADTTHPSTAEGNIR